MENVLVTEALSVVDNEVDKDCDTLSVPDNDPLTLAVIETLPVLETERDADSDTVIEVLPVAETLRLTESEAVSENE